MNKFGFFIVLLYTMNLSGQSDSEGPVSWHIYVDRASPESYEIHFDATIQQEWMIYSTQTPVGGPLPTELEIEENQEVVSSNAIWDGVKPQKEYEALFDQEVWKFKDQAKFIANIQSEKTNAIVKGTLTYMACNGRQCLPPTDVPFVVVLN